MQQITSRPVRELLSSDEVTVGIDPKALQGSSDDELDRLIPKFGSNANIHIVVAGSEAGKFSGICEGWTWRIGLDSTVTSRRIEK